jgi:hypothetical protein
LKKKERQEFIALIEALPEMNRRLLLNALREKPAPIIRRWCSAAGTLPDEDAKEMMAIIEETYGMASMKSDD